MQTLGKSNQSVVSEMSILDLEGLCCSFNYIYLPGALTVEGWLYGDLF